nr:lipoate--protein ligase family protein [Allorhodopirellula solitaria]
MAIDEAIVSAVAGNAVPPTLRFYGWSRPTLSLGYFQAADEAGDWAGEPVDLVRRSTGGGAIMHHRELTYSLSLPLADTGPGARQAVYRSVHACVIDTLKGLGVTAAAYSDVPARAFRSETVIPSKESRAPSDGLLPSRKQPREPFLCFQRRTDEDLICSGYKILGSAQRRVRGGVLQHGSLLLQVSCHADVLPGVADLAEIEIDPIAISQSIADGIAETMTLDWQSGELSAAERDHSVSIRANRYAAADWTRRR